MNEYKFDAEESLTKKVNSLIFQSQLWFSRIDGEKLAGKEFSADEMNELHEKLTEVIELSTRNNISFCLIGGMAALLNLIVLHENDEVR